MALQTDKSDRRRGLIHSLLIVATFMGLGLAAVDRMIGDPAAFPRPMDY